MKHKYKVGDIIFYYDNDEYEYGLVTKLHKEYFTLLIFDGYFPDDNGCIITVDYDSSVGLYSEVVSHIYDDELLAIAL
jgi:hypothetical protein